MLSLLAKLVARFSEIMYFPGVNEPVVSYLNLPIPNIDQIHQLIISIHITNTT